MSDSPATRCHALAETLAAMAREELTPNLVGLSPAQRKKPIAGYWQAQLHELGVMGQSVARSTQENVS